MLCWGRDYSTVMATVERQLERRQLQEKAEALDRQIGEYVVIDAELSSLAPGKAVYVRHTSGLVFYRADRQKTHSEHKQRLDDLRRERSAVASELEKLSRS